MIHMHEGQASAGFDWLSWAVLLRASWHQWQSFLATLPL